MEHADLTRTPTAPGSPSRTGDAAADVDGLLLDPAQRRVVDLAEGRSAAVLGAPGTGKTTLAVEVVADRVLGRAYAPEHVLVLASSRRAATALRDRIALRLGVPTNGPLARTANSVAFQVVRGALADADPTLLTGGEHDRIIAELIDGSIDDGTGPTWPESLGPEVRRLRGFRTELRDLLMRATEHGIGPGDLRRLGQSAGVPAWEAAADFAEEYAEVKDQFRDARFDAAELLAFGAAVVGESVREPEALAALGSLAEARCIVVDDAQDATEGTIALLRAFVRRGASVVALGDPDVAANAFRGGRADLLGGLGPALGVADVEQVVLEHARRGRPEIHEVVRAATSRIGTALGGPQRAARLVAEPDGAAGADGIAPIVRIDAPSHAAECADIAALLRERHLLDGVPWSRMVVVLRSGGEIAAVERALSVADVPTRTSAARSALRDEAAAALLLRAASYVVGREPLTAELAGDLLAGPLGRLDGVGLRRLRLALRRDELAAGGDRTGDELLVEALGVVGGFESIDDRVARRAGRLGRVLAEGRRVADAGGTIEEVLWAVWDGSGLAAEWAAQANGHGLLAEEANRALDAAVALFASAERFVERLPGAPARRFLDDVLGSDVPEDSLAPRRAEETVLVCTPQAVVGQEYDVVVVAGLQDGVWPNLKPRGSLLRADRLAAVAAADRAGEPVRHVVDRTVADERAEVRGDELRLFALAASRADRQLVLACTSNDDEQPSVLMAFADVPAAPRRRRPLHLRRLVASLRRELAATGSAEAAQALARLADAGVPGADPSEWYGLGDPSTDAPLVDLDGDPEARVHVSPSQIERAEESPIAWFVDTVAQTPSGLAASIGTIVHAVVEEASALPPEQLDVEAVWSAIEARWGELRFDAPWLDARERRSARVMAEGAAEYLAGFADDGKVLLQAEGRFTLELGRTLVRGTVDRVERSADGTVVIVDLKTGRTLPSVAGMPGHPQLGAYQAAARDGAVPVGDGEPGGAKLVFVAKPASGRAYTERVQQPFDDEASAAFAARVGAVGRIMAGSTFDGPLELGYKSPLGRWEYRVQLVKAVSA
ncbi:UrvD/REP family ATP-dependent DNA helicase [Agromyces mangrovi Wang et al. 2018]|uniref:UrvD/REP family ATP-dependent DNA helicase n=1 Tax=Agromyces mangrovi TaxID=1858653 RepID=UPI00257469E5|nr:UrvD/REP family ATP-dependent DNA helicase [Agromyces mangrovi]